MQLLTHLSCCCSTCDMRFFCCLLLLSFGFHISDSFVIYVFYIVSIFTCSQKNGNILFFFLLLQSVNSAWCEQNHIIFMLWERDRHLKGIMISTMLFMWHFGIFQYALPSIKWSIRKLKISKTKGMLMIPRVKLQCEGRSQNNGPNTSS